MPALTTPTQRSVPGGASVAGGTPGGRFVKGSSGNPRGGPRSGMSFTSLIREGVPQAEVISIMLALARGEPVVRHAEYTRALHRARQLGEPDPTRPVEADVVYPTIAEQQKAIEFLVGWGWQRPAERHEVAPAEPEYDLTLLSDEELEVYERLARKATGSMGPGASSGPAGAIPAASVERPALPPSG